jgi:hypothetical protein
VLAVWRRRVLKRNWAGRIARCKVSARANKNRGLLAQSPEGTAKGFEPCRGGTRTTIVSTTSMRNPATPLLLSPSLSAVFRPVPPVSGLVLDDRETTHIGPLVLANEHQEATDAGEQDEEAQAAASS